MPKAAGCEFLEQALYKIHPPTGEASYACFRVSLRYSVWHSTPNCFPLSLYINMRGCQNYGSLFGYPKYEVPYYNRDPKKGHNLDKHPYVFEAHVQQ